MNPIKHVAIIMDGNGRWGIKHKNSRNLGHKEGLKTVEKIIKSTVKNKIKPFVFIIDAKDVPQITPTITKSAYDFIIWRSTAPCLL